MSDLRQQRAIPRHAHRRRGLGRHEEHPRSAATPVFRRLVARAPLRVECRHLHDPSPSTLDLRVVIDGREPLMVDTACGHVQRHPGEHLEAGRDMFAHEIGPLCRSWALMVLPDEPPHAAILRQGREVERVDPPNLPAGAWRVRIQMRMDIDSPHQHRVPQAQVNRTSGRIHAEVYDLRCSRPRRLRAWRDTPRDREHHQPQDSHDPPLASTRHSTVPLSLGRATFLQMRAAR